MFMKKNKPNKIDFKSMRYGLIKNTLVLDQLVVN